MPRHDVGTVLRANFNRSIELRSAWSVLRPALIRQQLLRAMFSLLSFLFAAPTETRSPRQFTGSPLMRPNRNRAHLRDARAESHGTLELNAQRYLAGAIAGVFGCLHASDFSECRRGHIRRRRSVVQMIRQVRERALQLHANPFYDCEGFGQSARDRHCARTDKAADPAAPHRI